jgi:hypothetical protein
LRRAVSALLAEVLFDLPWRPTWRKLVGAPKWRPGEGVDHVVLFAEDGQGRTFQVKSLWSWHWPAYGSACPSCSGFHSRYRWYGSVMRKSPILPLAAAVTAVALGASPAQATSLLPGRRDEVKFVAFPVHAVKGPAPASVGSHVSHSSHSSHVSGIGGHNSHVSHVSHVSSVPAPAPTSPAPAPVASQPLVSASPSPAATASTAGSPAVTPQQSSPAVVNSGGPTPGSSNGKGCLFVVVAPFGALARRIRRLGRRGKRR